MLINIFRNNYNLSLSLTRSELEFFMGLIFVHGKHPKSLEFFELLLNNAKTKPDNQDIQKKVLSVLFNDELFYRVNPFAPEDNQRHSLYFKYNFYEENCNTDEYKTKFILLLSKAIKADIGVDLLSKIINNISIKDLLEYLVDKANEEVLN